MSKKPPVERPLPEEAFDRFVNAVDGPVNRVVERAMKSNVLLAPMSLYMSMSMRMLKAMRAQMQPQRKDGGR